PRAGGGPRPAHGWGGGPPPAPTAPHPPVGERGLKPTPAVFPPYAWQSWSWIGSAELARTHSGCCANSAFCRSMSAAVQRGLKGFTEVSVSPTEELPRNVCRATAAK